MRKARETVGERRCERSEWLTKGSDLTDVFFKMKASWKMD